MQVKGQQTEFHFSENSNKPSGGKEFKCEVGGDGYYPSPYSCEEYYMCNDGHAHHFKCAAGLLFNSQFNYCGWPKDVVCDLDAARQKAKEALIKKPAPQAQPQAQPQRPQQQNPPPVYKTPSTNTQNAFQFTPKRTQQQPVQQPQQQQQIQRQQPVAPPQQQQIQRQQPQINARPPQPSNKPNNMMDSAASNDPWNWSPFQQQQQNPVGLPFYWSCKYLNDKNQMKNSYFCK